VAEPTALQPKGNSVSNTFPITFEQHGEEFVVINAGTRIPVTSELELPAAEHLAREYGPRYVVCRREDVKA
jgi:hypothetical protein